MPANDINNQIRIP